MFFRNDAGELVHGHPTWEQQMRALGEAIGRWRRNNPPPPHIATTPAEERAQLVADARAEMLNEIYPLGGVEHEREWLRLTHQDIAEMPEAELVDERARARLRLMLDPTPEPWLHERVAALQQAIREARRATAE